ncbi:MAG: hypothetical protein KAX53_03445 [Saprospiraceae bacterium]|jgi:hypothetical protein|nr:hypothetical protein [Saprospiraceae bacterium]MBP6539055.1 hypothetical protein [Saprospiraceae bacterium]MBP8212771.1 hypothetical protein [Saprospiraceae bacterium]MBP9054838.1 hypothetical protein [Saprospiraceae bacterium]HQV65487.1 hypothetical protein [Saprospiraceae bacterium]
MMHIISKFVPTPVIEMAKTISTNQGGQWVENRQLRAKEASLKVSNKFNPKAARTRSF